MKKTCSYDFDGMHERCDRTAVWQVWVCTPLQKVMSDGEVTTPQGKDKGCCLAARVAAPVIWVEHLDVERSSKRNVWHWEVKLLVDVCLFLYHHFQPFPDK